ncbi:aspartate ammonia-lyase [Propionibacterium freudenreichii]|uniref:aspartate ammonia-lyase n=1 Tax=Propionibacterium freudenreichii TaxID=1744 RepID=UPI0020655BCD|nr:aspartate ammonia-lyase [Propionibacterium freudenreichii]MDK9645355.1 aspartate ammonia-lyase [Propionibacterium freudenreichii]UOL67595.1 aspartate ammonia-lyase [Propionibacterium freudenreichii]
MSTRIEVDLLGKREVPEDKYYGIHTVRALENFQLSGDTMNDVPEFIRGIVQVKKAAALANKELHALPGDVADAIVAACDAILDEGRCMDQFPTDAFQGGAGTSINMNTNEVIANLALELIGYPKGRYDLINPNDHVNKSQSTNDAYPTGFRLAVFTLVRGLVAEVDRLQASFAAKGIEFADVLKMGRTQLQDAVPMTLGEEFRGYSTNIREEVKRINIAADLLLETNMGGTAIGTGLNTPPGYAPVVTTKLAEVTGYPVVAAADLMESSYDNGAYIAVHSAMKRLAAKMSKICNDLRLLSSGPRAGINEINLPAMQAGSSIMPAKVNPVIPEVVNQVCFRVFGNDVTVCFAAEAGQLELNVMEPALSQAMFETVHLLTRACATLRERCVDGITANVERCREFVMNSIGIVTYLNDVIGHHNGDLVGKEAARTGKSVREVVIEMGLLTGEQVDAILTPENFLKPHYTGRFYSADEHGLPEDVAPKLVGPEG